MVTRYLIVIGLTAVLIGGCTAGRKSSDKGRPDWGASFESAKTNQILNPKAIQNLEPLTGFDGHAADIALEKYREDFERPAPSTIYSISIGGIGQR